VEVTWVREAVSALEATHVIVTLAVETSAQETAAAWDNVDLRVKDAKDQATLSEREALEWVSRVEAKNAVMLASPSEDAEGLAVTP
jgi:hypothetical protein